mgnify:CR=1 FL=1
MKKIIFAVMALFMASALLAKGDLHLFEVDNKDAAITPQKIEDAFVAHGFGIGVNSEMNKPFMIQFKNTEYKIFTLMTVFHNKLSFELVNKYPQMGIFIPMEIGIYQNKKENTLHVSVATAEALQNILKIKDPLLKELENEILSALKKALPKAKHSFSEEVLQDKNALVTQYELEVSEDDFKEDFSNALLGLNNGLSLYGFVVPSKLNVNEKIKNSNYDIYQTYSICKLPVIYTVSLTNPKASAFAPCSMALYKKRGESKVVIAFPSVYNWLSSAGVKNKDSREVLVKAQKQLESILAEVVE